IQRYYFTGFFINRKARDVFVEYILPNGISFQIEYLNQVTTFTSVGIISDIFKRSAPKNGINIFSSYMYIAVSHDTIGNCISTFVDKNRFACFSVNYIENAICL